jgi:hypothetical protein
MFRFLVMAESRLHFLSLQQFLIDFLKYRPEFECMSAKCAGQMRAGIHLQDGAIDGSIVDGLPSPSVEGLMSSIAAEESCDEMVAIQETPRRPRA